MYISYIVLCDIYIMKLMYVYVQTLIMLLRLGMHTKYINKNKTKTMHFFIQCRSTEINIISWNINKISFNVMYTFTWGGGGGWHSVTLSSMTMFQHLYSQIAHCM